MSSEKKALMQLFLRLCELSSSNQQLFLKEHCSNKKLANTLQQILEQTSEYSEPLDLFQILHVPESYQK